MQLPLITMKGHKVRFSALHDLSIMFTLLKREVETMLTEKQCMQIEHELTTDIEPRKLAAYLSLHMGLTISEIVPLKVSNVDFIQGTLQITQSLSLQKNKCFQIIPAEKVRILQMPNHVINLFRENRHLFSSGDCYLLSGTTQSASPYVMQNLLTSIGRKCNIKTEPVTSSKLREAFIRRGLEQHVDVYTLCYYSGTRNFRDMQKRYEKYMTPNPAALNALNQFTESYENPASQKPECKRMNLLILGAGSQGQVVKETAEAIGIFEKIAFLDDNPNNPLAIDTCINLKKYVAQFPIAFVSFGNAELREKYINALENAGYILPTLIHPMATLSTSCHVGEATIVEAKSIIGANAVVHRGCIISSASVIDVNAVVSEYSHIDCSATVAKSMTVPSHTKVPSGTVFRNE